MKSQALAFLFSTLSLGACSAAGGGSVAGDELRHLPAFSSVTLNGVGTLRVRRGPQEVRLLMDGRLAKSFETKVAGDRLLLGFKCSFGLFRRAPRAEDCVVEISIPSLSGIACNGAGRVEAGEIDCGELKVEINGAGTVELRGRAERLVLSCNGAARLDARGLRAAAAKVGMTGAARVKLEVARELEASITGAGELLYWGEPRVAQKVSGAGRVARGE